MTETDLKILYEDDDITVVDKPAGVSTHPAPGEQDVTLAELVAGYLGNADETGMSLVVHRLDKGTSGVILFAKNSKAREILQKQFADRQLAKTYLTLVSGKLDSGEGIINIPLGRNTRLRERIDPKAEGKQAVTEFSVITEYKDFTYIEARPKTGRTHQIRTHFSAIGHPVAGDTRYGYKGMEVPRIFLHATKLEFTHPITGKQTVISSPLPGELEQILTSLSS